MYQIRNLLCRPSVSSDPGENLKAAEDFLLVLLHAHAVSAANTVRSVTEVESLQEFCKVIVANYVLLPEYDVT